MKTWGTIATVVLLLVAAAIGLVVGVYGIWPPDIDGRRLTIVAAVAADGTQFRVEQIWNHVDFYSTLLYVTPPSAKQVAYVIDPDDRKQWRGDIQFAGRTARIMFGNKEQGEYDLQTRKFFKGGVEFEGTETP